MSQSGTENDGNDGNDGNETFITQELRNLSIRSHCDSSTIILAHAGCLVCWC